jgi:hypothetical protein
MTLPEFQLLISTPSFRVWFRTDYAKHLERVTYNKAYSQLCEQGLRPDAYHTLGHMAVFLNVDLPSFKSAMLDKVILYTETFHDLMDKIEAKQASATDIEAAIAPLWEQLPSNFSQ